MYARTALVRCHSYHVPPRSRVGIFPVHLDPPTQQHAQMFRLLLGQSAAPSSALPSGTVESRQPPAARRVRAAPPDAEVTAPSWVPTLPTKHVHLASLAESLASDSQLAPLDDIILVPNTRYPVSLRHSTHLAALSVLAARDVANVHVDFTALEHPDDSMPVVYELTQQFPNAVIVQWLHNAYEMLHWRNFADLKMTVPLLLLQTYSLPISELVSPRAARLPGLAATDARNGTQPSAVEAGSTADPSVARTVAAAAAAGASARPGGESLLSSRMYLSPTEEQNPQLSLYYAEAGEHIQQMHRQRYRRTHPALASDAYGRLAATGAAGPADHTGDASQLVRGMWWLSPGGRGDDRVEMSRAYINSASSSWLGSPWATARSRRRRGPSVKSGAARHAEALAGSLPLGDSAGIAAGAAEPDEDLDGDALDEDAYRYEVRADGEDDERLLSNELSNDVIVTSDGSLWVRHTQPPSPSCAPPPAAAAATAGEEEDDRSRGGRDIAAAADADSNEALWKEFAEVRAALHEMMHVEHTLPATATPPANAPARTPASAAAVPPLAQCPAPQHGLRARGRPVRRLHRVDPNSILSRRTVRDLLAEMFPALSLTHTVALAGTHRAGPFAASSSVPPMSPAAAIAAPAARSPPATESPASERARYAAVASSLRTTRAVPVVEVHPVSRTTGADVRQALWEQDVAPATILSDAVAKYVESHGLYRDDRKSAAAGAFASMGSGSSRAGVDVGAGWHGDTYSASSSLLSAGVFGDDEQRAAELATSTTASAPLSALLSLSSDTALLGTMAPAAGSTLAQSRGTNINSGSGSGSNASGISSSHSPPAVLRRVLQQKEHTYMTFPGIIPRLELHHDKNNLLAREQYEKLKGFRCHPGEAPDLIVPIGGDGYMMHCIRSNWRRFIPFYGVNAGHVGYLLNDCTTLEELFSSPLKLHTMNMLYCQAETDTETGERVLLSELAFNDAWVERSSGQTALIRVLVNGEERIRRLRGDGVLVSTAAGSTAYSQALGASPVPVGAPLIQVVGSNVVSPAQWRPVHLDQEDQVEVEVIDSFKRPCRCFVDSVDMGNVTRMLVRSSRVAGVTLAFSKSCDLQHKLYQMQFPKTM